MEKVNYCIDKQQTLVADNTAVLVEACVTCYLMASCSILSGDITKAATLIEQCASDFEKLSKIVSDRD